MALRHFTRRRGNFLVAWMICEFVIGGVALPLLAYMGWAATDAVERFTMDGARVADRCGLMWVWRGGTGLGSRLTTALDHH